MIILPSHVGQPLTIKIPLYAETGHHLASPTVADGDITAKFGSESQLSNKHAASPGAGEFRTDVTDGFVVLTFASTQVLHASLRVAWRDLAGAQWLSDIQEYRLLPKKKTFDANYIREYGYDGTTVVAHKALSKIQVSNGDSPETFTDVVVEDARVEGDIPA